MVLGRYLIVGCLDPWGKDSCRPRLLGCTLKVLYYSRLVVLFKGSFGKCKAR